MHMLMMTAIGLALLALFQVGTMLLNRHRAGRAIKSQHVFIWDLARGITLWRRPGAHPYAVQATV